MRVDGAPCARPAARLAAACAVEVRADALAALAAARRADENCAAEAMALDIVHEDSSLLVLNKPAGLVVHPGSGNRSGTLLGGLLHHHAGAAALARGGIVHRLDKDTSGLMVVAKTAAAQRDLIGQFKSRACRREYLALVCGSPPPTGEVALPIGRHRQQRARMAVAASGRAAATSFVCAQRWRGFALLRCRLHSGRTHQIRVHLEHQGFPVAGDRVYNRRARPLPFAAARQLLHAATLALRHPDSGAACRWESPLPADMEAAVAALNSCQ